MGKIVRTGIDGLEIAMSEILKDIGEGADDAARKASIVAAKEMKTALASATPTRSGELKNSWRVQTDPKDKKAKIVKNTKKVKGKKGKIPLTNIIEYSTTRGRPFITKTVEHNTNRVADIYLEKLKKGIEK